MAAPGYTEIDKAEDVKALHSMGYAQELERRLSRFSNFAFSFSIIYILSGCINWLAKATSGAGGIGRRPKDFAMSGMTSAALTSPTTATTMLAGT
jgi:hypothetical protein